MRKILNGTRVQINVSLIQLSASLFMYLLQSGLINILCPSWNRSGAVCIYHLSVMIYLAFLNRLKFNFRNYFEIHWAPNLTRTVLHWKINFVSIPR